MLGKWALSVSPSHQRSSAPRLEPMQMARPDLMIAGALVPQPPSGMQWLCVCLRVRVRVHANIAEGWTRMRHPRRRALLGLAVLGLLCAACARHAAPSADERLQAIYTSEWKWRS